MCWIKRRRKNVQSQRSDQTIHLKSGRGDGTATESSKDPVIKTAEETKTPDIKIQACNQHLPQQQKQSQPTNKNNKKNDSPKVPIKSNENVFEDSVNNNDGGNGNDGGGGGGGGKTAETEKVTLGIGTPSTFEKKKFEKAKKKQQHHQREEQKQSHQLVVHQQQPQREQQQRHYRQSHHQQLQQQQVQQQQYQQIVKSSHTSTPEEIKLDKTQHESLAPATTQAASKVHHHQQQQSHQKPHHPQNERKKQQAAAPETTDYKTTPTPLFTDYITKKVEKENYEELSRIPLVKTANIQHEKFPYSNQDNQDTMAGISSNFSKTIEIPDENSGKNKRESCSSKKKKTKKNTIEDDATQECSKKSMRQHQ